jgi:hypothetical protein
MKKKFPLTDKQYLKNPTICPVCRSSDISGGQVDVDMGSCWQEIECEDCGAKWTDIYKLIGYADLRKGKAI